MDKPKRQYGVYIKNGVFRCELCNYKFGKLPVSTPDEKWAAIHSMFPRVSKHMHEKHRRETNS